VNRWVGHGPLPVSARSRRAAALMSERFTASYELDGFSLNRTAEAITDHLARLDRWPVTDADAGDFCFEVRWLLREAGPVLIDLAGEALGVEVLGVEVLGVDARTDPAEVTSIAPVSLPRLVGTGAGR